MEWFHSKKRNNAEWKQESTGQNMATVSPFPTLHLLVIFGIVIGLLWFSHYTSYKAQQHHTAIYFHLFVLLSPLLLILFLVSYSACGRINFGFIRSKHESLKQAMTMVSPGNFAMLLMLMVLLLSLSYQSSYHSKWFGPLWTLD